MGDTMVELDVIAAVLTLNLPLYIMLFTMNRKQGEVNVRLGNIEKHIRVKMTFKQ